MARLFPIRSEAPSQESHPRIVDLEDEDADAVFSALSSTTARQIYSHLGEEPGTPSDVADAIDSSIQNVRYHLEKLEDAGLIEVVDTWYSSRGNEMSVYAPSNGPLIVTSDRSKATQLREALSRFLGGLGVLAGASLFLQYGLEQAISSAQSAAGWRPAFGGEDDAEDLAGNGNGNGDAAPMTQDAEEREGEEAETQADAGDDAARDEGTEEETYYVDDADDTATDAPAGADDSVAYDTTSSPAEYGSEATETLLSTLPPGLLFFLGGLLVLTIVTVWWYRSTY